jgi:hypothetical protein
MLDFIHVDYREAEINILKINFIGDIRRFIMEPTLVLRKNYHGIDKKWGSLVQQ